MRRAVCPGSFDPVTHGHLDVITRAAALFDEVIVGVGTNVSKSKLFSPQERMGMMTRACDHLDNVRVDGFSGLLTDYCREHSVPAIVKGLRGGGDFDYEVQMAQMNQHLTGVDTVFLATASRVAFVSSSLVKEVASLGGDVTGLLPEFAQEALLTRLAERA